MKLTHSEYLHSYNRLWNKRHRDTQRDFRIQPRRVKLIYPDCAAPDYMSKTEYQRFNRSDFPEGTLIWMDGVRIN